MAKQHNKASRTITGIMHLMLGMASANALALGDVRWKLTGPICGTLRSQAVFYALSFFWLDGFAVPAPAQVTQTVGTSHAK